LERNNPCLVLDAIAAVGRFCFEMFGWKEPYIHYDGLIFTEL